MVGNVVTALSTDSYLVPLWNVDDAANGIVVSSTDLHHVQLAVVNPEEEEEEEKEEQHRVKEEEEKGRGSNETSQKIFIITGNITGSLPTHLIVSSIPATMTPWCLSMHSTVTGCLVATMPSFLSPLAD